MEQDTQEQTKKFTATNFHIYWIEPGGNANSNITRVGQSI